MTSDSTIKDLKAAIDNVEAKKRVIDEQHNALVTALEYFENIEEQGVGAPTEDSEDEDNMPW